MNLAVSNLRRIFPVFVAIGFLGCGSSSNNSPGDPSVGGTQAEPGTGGQTAGQATLASGGNSAVATGGVPATESSTGGSLQTGGTATGGSAPSLETGGNSAGGSETGGQATGGRSTNVSTATGGRSTGGGETGGRSTGGNAAGGMATGGGATGGASSTAGAGTGPTFPPKFVGNITTSGGHTDVGSLKYATYWNQVTPQNEGKWGSVSSAKGQYNWSSLDTLHNYTKANNMVFKQHVFVWGSQQPTFSITEADVKDWMTQFCTRYPDVAVIDVVNEPPPHTTPSYANAIGGGTNGDWAWITNAFKWARAACPKAILVFNDFNNLEWDQDNAHFIDIVNTIKKNGAPLDAIGCQAHDLDHTNSSGALDVDLAGVTKRLNNLIAAHPNIYITEMDISTKDDAAQLAMYKQYFPLFWGSANVKGITIWGWVVGQTWSLAPDSGLITSSGTKRPAFTWLLQQIGKG